MLVYSLCNTYVPEKVSFLILEADGKFVGILEPELVLAVGDALVVVVKEGVESISTYKRKIAT